MDARFQAGSPPTVRRWTLEGNAALIPFVGIRLERF